MLYGKAGVKSRHPSPKPPLAITTLLSIDVWCLSFSVVVLKVSAFFLNLEKVVLSRTYPLSSSGGVYC